MKGRDGVEHYIDRDMRGIVVCVAPTAEENADVERSASRFKGNADANAPTDDGRVASANLLGVTGAQLPLRATPAVETSIA